MDLRAVTASPQLWHQLDGDVRRAIERRWLPQGNDALHELRERIDGVTAHAKARDGEPG